MLDSSGFQASADVHHAACRWRASSWCPPFAGEGAYGKVYMGLNLHSGVMMAVKELQLVGRRGSEEVNAQLRELTQVSAWLCCNGVCNVAYPLVALDYAVSCCEPR